MEGHPETQNPSFQGRMSPGGAQYPQPHPFSLLLPFFSSVLLFFLQWESHKAANAHKTDLWQGPGYGGTDTGVST